MAIQRSKSSNGVSDLVVIHITHNVSRLAGGLFESVRHLSQSVRLAGGVRLKVLGLADAKTAEDIKCWEPLDVQTFPVFGPERFGYAPGLVRELKASKPQLIHLHGLWKHSTFAVWRWARRTRTPYVVSPHGMLEPWALKQSRIRKAMAAWLYQMPCLRRATCIRATSRMEVESVRLAGFRNPIALVPNGVVIPDEPSAVHKGLSRPKRALFLSRIHPKKGLLNLVRAWKAVLPVGWQLDIVGPDEGGHLAEVQAAVQQSGIGELVHFPGEVWGDARWRLYGESDLFVLPSFSENFGLVIAEALACGVPVITTRATPWEEIEHHRCGWWIDTGVEPLAQALKEATSMPPAQLSEMGQRGRRLIAERYAWGPLGRKMVQVYQWMLGCEPKPDCVIEP